ncbi:hypothetical protein [Paraburkholderia bannensis]|uniref:hypothetical protein n=1 Tax=Paraburkholderia bannensis TaxID=765414 RepID=UPI002AB75E9D|nr:hypothetical protein [Paraburkholderia bannensis]
MNPTRLCSRHGERRFERASPRIAQWIRDRGAFGAGEPVKVSLDRAKCTVAAWMTWTELREHEAVTTMVDGVAHVHALPMIAKLRGSWEPVCPDCRDELLVRSGVEPDYPTPVERAFDMSPIADNAESRQPLFACSKHGILRQRLASPAIVKAVSRGVASLGGRSIKVIVRNTHGEQVLWFDQALLRYALGDQIDVASGVYRIENGSEAQLLRELGWPVCGQCLEAWVKGDPSSPAS